MGTVTLAVPSLHAEFGIDALMLAHFTPRLAMELVLLTLLFASLVSSVMAVRYYNHAGFVGGMPVESDARKQWTPAGTAYVRKAGVLYSWGLRQLVLVAPLVAFILHPLAGPIAAVVVSGVLFSFDHATTELCLPTCPSIHPSNNLLGEHLMALVFEQLLTKELGDASYLIGDDSERVAAVVDPQVDVEQYLELARKRGLSIKYVVQTHIHEDFVSGACALAAATGGAEVCVSGHDEPEYGFAHRLLHDGEVLELGAVQLTIKHTPGHTPRAHLTCARKDRQKGRTFRGSLWRFAAR
jgi:Protein of unknown function, DUF599/Metallo-beta-lactamase superfamily